MLLSTAAMSFPLVALALTEDAFDVLVYLINSSILALIGIATLLFMYGVVRYVIAQGDEKKIAEGRQYMLWGIIGLTVMVAIWGFVNLVINTIFGSTATGLSSPSITPLSGRTRGVSICIFGVCF